MKNTHALSKRLTIPASLKNFCSYSEIEMLFGPKRDQPALKKPKRQTCLPGNAKAQTFWKQTRTRTGPKVKSTGGSYHELCHLQKKEAGWTPYHPHQSVIQTLLLIQTGSTSELLKTMKALDPKNLH